MSRFDIEFLQQSPDGKLILLEQVVDQLFEHFEREGLGREALLVFARKLQREFTGEHGKPCSWGLENLMRAVICILTPNDFSPQEYKRHIFSDLEAGVRGVAGEFAPKWPGRPRAHLEDFFIKVAPGDYYYQENVKGDSGQ